MGKSVLSAKPKSFKLHRKSTAASKLKSVISDKLHHFLSDYSDTVLADYILVLVCNGKDQYQTRDDLDAFLGHRSSLFVSWLWDHLLKHDYHTVEHTYSLPSDPALPCSIYDSAPHKDSTPNHEKNNPPPPVASDSHSDLSNMEFGEGGQCPPGFAPPLSEVNITTKLSPTLGNESFKKLSSTMVLADGQCPIGCFEKPEKIVYSSGHGSASELLYIPKREPVSGNLQFSASEYSLSKQILASNVVTRSLSPRSISEQYEKSRVSVWDRLGKPFERTPARGETAEAQHVCATKQHEQVLNRHMLMLSQLSGEASRNNVLGVLGLGKSCGMNNPSNCRKIKHDVSTIHKSHNQNNIGQKSLVSVIATGPATSLVSLVDENNVDFQCTRNSKKFLKSILAHKDSKTTSLPAQTSSTDSKCSITATIKPVQEVHFAATKETLSLYFAKCGVVVQVIFFTDKATDQPKRSAYVTFASKQSVDNAVALSGASLLSRTIKVVRKSEAAAATTSAQFAPILCQASLSNHTRKALPSRPFYSSSHLQWRRDSMSAPSEASVHFCIEGKVSDSSTNQEQPGLILSALTTEENSSTELSEAA